MAIGDKKISELPSASVVLDHDLLVLEQDGVAKNMSGDLLLKFLKPLLNEAVALLPVSKSLDFTTWPMGYIVETLSDGSTIEHPVVLDTEGSPTNIGGIKVQGISVVGSSLS